MKKKSTYTEKQITEAFAKVFGKNKQQLNYFMKQLNNKETEYKLRAECFDDIRHFGKLAKNKISNIIPQPCGSGIPDYKLVFTSKLGIDELRKIMKKVPDGHVMRQTLNFKGIYTGKRNMDID